MFQVVVLYPQPKDVLQFEADYIKHLEFFHEKTGIPKTEKPYSVTKFMDSPQGPSQFYQMFVMPFPTAEIMQGALADPGMQEVSADAFRISSGGSPIIIAGEVN
jgi:uncharacterized protein (TIGR02118 family)